MNTSPLVLYNLTEQKSAVSVFICIEIGFLKFKRKQMLFIAYKRAQFHSACKRAQNVVSRHSRDYIIRESFVLQIVFEKFLNSFNKKSTPLEVFPVILWKSCNFNSEFLFWFAKESEIYSDLKTARVQKKGVIYFQRGLYS